MTNPIAFHVFATPHAKAAAGDGLKLTKHIGLLVFQECSVKTAGAIGDTFHLANEFERAGGEEPPYRFSVLSDEGGLVRCSSSISIWTQSLERYSVADFHAVFVACRDAMKTARANDRLLSWIGGQGSIDSFRIQRGPNLAVVCKNDLQSTVPLFLFEDGLSEAPTRGPTPAELALVQVERDLSTDTARKIARVLDTDFEEPARSVYADSGITTTADKIRESARWIKDNYSSPISVAQAAEAAAMSRRNFQRRFKCEFGITPLEYLLRTRFEIVCDLLMSTNLPVDKIARRCGMGDGNRLGRLFKERYGMSPTQYRVQQKLELVERVLSSEATSDTAVEILRVNS
jgi:transcriptional regulator GlxA family with amidase domain